MENNKIIQIQNLSFKYDKEDIIQNLSLDIKQHKITTFLGANGCGKSTLLYLLSNQLAYKQGNIYFYRKPYHEYNRKEFAQKIAIVHQQNVAPEDICVEELVSYGRIPHRGLQASNTKEDQEKIDWAIEVTDLQIYRKRKFIELSGGQKQRVWIAMALAQDTEVILFDEPTTYLDIHYQIEVLKLIDILNKEYHKTIIMVLHDLNQAIHYSDEIVLFEKEGKRIWSGEPNEMITEYNLELVFQRKLTLFEHNGKKVVLTV